MDGEEEEEEEEEEREKGRKSKFLHSSHLFIVSKVDVLLKSVLLI